ncbi:MAG: 4-diphosphocytidyl-2-C-methyl-D-erythritol kinase [Gaiellaceae bacterium]|nr:4-diphosphocytidyl-2-C-methyl-D-erythritol kinase [Gaiellaceae bacterium]
MIRGPAPAKINLALVVGPLRADGKHELLTLYQRVGLSDRIELRVADRTGVEGYAGDTIVRDALELLAAHAASPHRWHATIEKRIPVAAGLGGGSSDAATALHLANGTLAEPVPREELLDLAGELGADVPFFLHDGPCLGSGDGTTLGQVDVPQDFWVVLALPAGAAKPSTAAVYAEFDARQGADGWEERRTALLDALDRVRRPRDLAALPPNDLASSPLAAELRSLGAFRADVSGAGPTVYGLFHHRATAQAAQRALKRSARTWLTAPAWYG